MARARTEPPAGEAERSSAASNGGETPPDTPETAERLSAPQTSLAEALLAAQQEMPTLTKDATNPHYDSKFLSLTGIMEAVLPILHRHGIVLMQYPTTLGDDLRPALRTDLWHAASGQAATSVMLLLASKNDPQGQGSALTYARRYMLSAMLALVADEDDDGNAASRQREQSDADRAGKLRGRIGELCVALDVQTKAEPGTWLGLVKDATVSAFENPYETAPPPTLEEVGKYLKSQQEAGITEVPDQLDLTVPF